MSETKVVHYHACPVLGKQAKVIKGILGNFDGSKLYGWQYCCPFCRFTIGELQPMSTYEDETEVLTERSRK